MKIPVIQDFLILSDIIEKVKVVREEGEALSVDESDNIVRIMSIHKSKGLQLPIVFLANATSKFRPEKDAIATMKSMESDGLC